MCGVHSQLGASFWRSEVGAGAPNSVVTRGSGTGLSGGSLPSHQCIVLCTVKMNRILDLDAANLTLEVEPGATTLAIAEAAEKAGLFYPPDPGSMKISTIGGNVAENSGGLRGLKYGVTRNYVMGLEVVLPDGSICYLGEQMRQGCRRIFLEGSFYWFRRHLGDYHQSPPAPHSQTSVQTHHGGHLSADGSCRRSGFSDHCGPNHTLHLGVPRSHDHSLC